MPSYAEIKQQIAQLERQAAEQRKTEVASVITDIRNKMVQYGLTVQDIGPINGKGGSTKSPKATKVSSPAKYKDPVTGKTWTGHGKAPAWIVEATKKGKRDDYLIDRSKESKQVKATKPVKVIKATKAAPKAKLTVSAKPTAKTLAVIAPKTKKTVIKKVAPKKATTKATAVKKPAPSAIADKSTTA